jgi:hypothetical protein
LKNGGELGNITRSNKVEQLQEIFNKIFRPSKADTITHSNDNISI